MFTFHARPSLVSKSFFCLAVVFLVSTSHVLAQIYAAFSGPDETSSFMGWQQVYINYYTKLSPGPTTLNGDFLYTTMVHNGIGETVPPTSLPDIQVHVVNGVITTPMPNQRFQGSQTGAFESVGSVATYFAETNVGDPRVTPSGSISVTRLDDLFNVGNFWTPPPDIDLACTITISVAPPDNLQQDNNSTKPNDETAGGSGANGRSENDTVGSTNDSDCGMARYTVDLLTADLRVTDTPLQYVPPVGPKIDFLVTYTAPNRENDNSPSTFPYSNLGADWNFNWLSYVTDDPNDSSINVTVFVRGGGTEVYPVTSGSPLTYRPDPQNQAVLVRTSDTPTQITYEKRFRDGSKQIFGHSDQASTYPRTIFMTQIVDARGQAATLHYDGSNRIDTITDALGQVTTLCYNHPTDLYKITKVRDPFSHEAIFTYTGNSLSKITDPMGISSQFFYLNSFSNIMTELDTPYGFTEFDMGHGFGGDGTHRWITIYDVNPSTQSVGLERVEYFEDAPGICSSDPPSSVPTGFSGANSDLNKRNTFYWDKKTLSMFPPSNGTYDYTKARITHWLVSADGFSVSGIKASEKAPLENRVWCAYANQADPFHAGSSDEPIKTARVLDDGTTQLWRYEYNAVGNLTKTTDPVGRIFTNVYADNGVDVIEKRQQRGTNNELLASFTYNSKHEPLVETDAAGQQTQYGYNAAGQLTSIQNAKGEVTTYVYGNGTGVPSGYLASIAGPVFNSSSAVKTFTYDTANRVHSVTNSPDNYQIVTDYDNLDRPTQITYPDGTNKQFHYAQDFGAGPQPILDLTASKDRLDRWTYRHYDNDRHLDSVTDPLGRTTLYTWCTCGSLASITDPNGNVTAFDRDVEGRLKSKVFTDCTAITYEYEGTTSRLKSMTDALNQITNYSYFVDDTLQQVSYTNAQNPTPTVSYTYDPNYNRVASMADGTGTTHYIYNPVPSPPTLGANQLYQVVGPLSNDTITYTYDELGRALSQDINGTTASVTYDPLGRLNTTTNALGSFSRGYDGVTPRLQTLTYPNGQTANYSYYGNTGDRRLQTLQHLTSGSVNFSRHDYTYDPEGQIQSWTKTLGTTETDL